MDNLSEDTEVNHFTDMRKILESFRYHKSQKIYSI